MVISKLTDLGMLYATLQRHLETQGSGTQVCNPMPRRHTSITLADYTPSIQSVFRPSPRCPTRPYDLETANQRPHEDISMHHSKSGSVVRVATSNAAQTHC